MIKFTSFSLNFLAIASYYVRFLTQSVKFLLLFLTSFLVFAENNETNQKPNTQETLMGFKVTTGAAAGYVEDLSCKSCHLKHWESYQEVGMSHSFAKAETGNYIEDFTAEDYYHQNSQRYYKIKEDQGLLYFNRYQLDHKGEKINVFERQIDWILGSGNKSRSYLYQNPTGEIYQLPLGWYSETKQWRMAPGFEGSIHFGIQRQVRRECLFCHNAFPQVPEGSDNHWQPHTFPAELPHGTGCQRCHGPGANHIKTIINGGTIEQIHSSIVNPAKLSAEKRDSVCFQCHLLPSVAMPGARDIKRNDYSFRPGELLSDYLIHVDINDPEHPKSDRFEINHHAYRLRQSECFSQSEGKLTCISCHNPHVKIKPEERVEHFKKVCLGCHQSHEISSESKTVKEDCTSCHMPQRRTQDVIEVVMTDHNIQKIAASEQQRLAPIHKKEPIIESVDLIFNAPKMTKLMDKIYTTLPILRSLTSLKTLMFYEDLLSQSEAIDPLFYMDLAIGQTNTKQHKAALMSLEKVLSKYPENLKALQLYGVAHISLREYQTAETILNKALSINDKVAEIHFNLALLFISTNRYNQAAEHLDKAKELKPTLTLAWYYAGYLETLNNKPNNAIQNYKRALEIDPSFQKAYLSIAKSYLEVNNKKEAIRYLKHGIKVTSHSSDLVNLLDKITQEE